jgi:hypothetical protein
LKPHRAITLFASSFSGVELFDNLSFRNLFSNSRDFCINLPLSKTIGFLGMDSGDIWRIRRIFHIGS